MKKASRLFLIIVIIFAIMMASSPLNVLAKSDPSGTTSNPFIAGGTWTTGNELDVTSLAASAPQWLQLLANGVKVTEAGKICHPFRGGQFGWVGEIRQYKAGEWIKLPTTNDWVPNKEGEFMSCALAPAAGTYALFGYWIKPAGYVEPPTSTCNYLTTDWNAERSNSNEDSTQDIDISGLQVALNGLTLTLTVTSDPEGMMATDTYSSTISSGVANYLEVLTPINGSVEFTISVSGCSKSFTFTFVD